MKIYFDENFSYHLVDGLKSIQDGRKSEDVLVTSIEEEFGRGTPDEVWIPSVAQKHGVAITQDLNIHRARAQWDLCNANKIGIFFFRPPKKEKAWKYWDVVQLLIKLWPEMKQIAKEERRPFGYVADLHKARLQKL